MVKKIGKLEPVAVRDIFPHEAHDFTKWLAENIDILSARIGLPLVVEETEVSIGKFRADIVCRDSQGNKVIIENQLEQSNHDHFGKLMTYMGNLKATTGIWITPDPRIEHQVAIEDFKQRMKPGQALYLVKIEAVRIGNSIAAPLFTVISRPEYQPEPVLETNVDQYVSNPDISAKYQDSTMPSVWCMYPRRDEETYNLYLKEHVIGIGFGDDMGDLSKLPATSDAFREKWSKTYPESTPKETSTFHAMFFSFVHRMKIDDLVIYAPTWRERKIYIGKIVTGYKFIRTRNPFYTHRRQVEWLYELPRDHFSPDALRGITVNLAIFQARSEMFLSELERLIT
jgi:hypothetical protein